MSPVFRLLDNGNLLMPGAGYDERLGIFWDGMAEIGPDHPDYGAYLAEIKGAEGGAGEL